MKREKRRVRLARRQMLLADVSQRAAMRGLADALVEENRSAALAERSRALTSAYGGRSQASDGAALSHTARFAGAIAHLATDAEAARDDAQAQARWQAETLGQAQTRARLQSERLEGALAAYRSARERREHDPSNTPSHKSLARVMHSETHDTTQDVTSTNPHSGATRPARTTI
ncbi:MAG: hypothetical protein AAF291_08415 [Pseudomonadota bacterium]